LEAGAAVVGVAEADDRMEMWCEVVVAVRSAIAFRCVFVFGAIFCTVELTLQNKEDDL